MKYLMLVLILFGCSSGDHKSPHSHIRDPKNYLKQVDQFISSASFDKTFRCGSEFTYELKQCARRCEPFFCKEICQKPVKSKVKIGKCDGHSVSFLNNKNKIWIRVNRNNFHNLNFIRAMMAAPKVGQIEKSGEPIGKNLIEIHDAVPEMYMVGGKKYDAIRIHFLYMHFNEKKSYYTPSFQSIVLGKSYLTGGLLLEHKFEDLKHPVSKMVDITLTN